MNAPPDPAAPTVGLVPLPDFRQSLPRPRDLLLALATIALGVVVLVVATVLRGVDIGRERDGAPAARTPATLTVTARPGTYQVFERVPSGPRPVDVPVEDAWPVHLTPALVTVTGPDGAEVPTRAVPTIETLEPLEARYRASVEFDTGRGGAYTVAIAGEPADVIVAIETSAELDPFSHPGPLTIVGLVLFFAGGLGLVYAGRDLMAWRWNRRARQRARRALAAAGASATPPNWYPDPSDARRLRWWDGHAWTGHVTAPHPEATRSTMITGERSHR